MPGVPNVPELAEPVGSKESIPNETLKTATTATPVATESLTALSGVPGAGKVVVFSYTAKHEASGKVKLIHNLNTEAVIVQAFKATSKKPGVNMELSASVAGAIAKWEPVTNNETLVTLGTGEPVAKEEFFYMVIG